MGQWRASGAAALARPRPACARSSAPAPLSPLANGERRRARRPGIGGAGTQGAGTARDCGAGGSERAAGRPGASAMGDPELELAGAQDDFHSQFADELEVLAELEGGRGLCRSLIPRRTRGLPGGGEGSGGREAGTAPRREPWPTVGARSSGAAAVNLVSCRDGGPVALQGPLAHGGPGPPAIRGGRRWRGRRHSLLSGGTAREPRRQC